jgi:predicted GTPase
MQYRPVETKPRRQYIALRQGNLVTKKELTILLVGETGVGKTTFFTMVTNILEGRDPSNYRVAHNLSNEIGGSKEGSQTNTARLYEFTSVNGVKDRLLDTPGFADTCGIEYDRRHKASIAKAIRDAIPSIDEVLFMANGTTERLQLATDYAIATLSSIFPHSIASNISFLFTMISNPMAFNFRIESLPDCLQGAEMFNLDNPIALRRKYEVNRKT